MGNAAVRDLWRKQDAGEFHDQFAPEIPWHGAGLYRISPVPPNGNPAPHT